MKNLSKFIIIFGVLVALLGLVAITPDPSEDLLTVSVDGISVIEPSIGLTVYGSTDDEYVNNIDAFVVVPGQDVQILMTAYNPTSVGKYYKGWVYTGSSTLYSAPEAFIMPDCVHDWDYTYTAPESGRVSIYVETAVNDPFGSYGYLFDDVDSFDIQVLAAPTPTPTSTPLPTAAPTAAPTTALLPNPCEGVICQDYCDGGIYYYHGVCGYGQCEYQTEFNSAECATPTATPTATPIISPPPTDDSGLGGLFWWGGIVVVLLISFVVALRDRK